MDNDNLKDQFTKRILIVASIGLLLSCLGVAAMSIWPLFNQLATQQTDRLIFAAKTRTMVVEQFIEKAKETARQITSRSKAREALERYNSHTIDLNTFQVYTAPILQDALNLSDFAVGISRFDMQGTLVIQIGLATPENVLHAFDLAGKELVLSGPVNIINDLFAVVTAPIRNRQDKRVGTDIVLFKISKLRDMIRDYTGLGTTGETILGRLSVDKRPELFFKPRSATEPEYELLRSPSQIIIGQAINEACALDRDGNVHVLESSHKIATYSPVEGSDWGIVVTMDKSELFEAVTRRVLIIGLVVVVLVIPLGIVGLIFLLRPVTRRMLFLVDTLQQEIAAKENAICEQGLAERKLIDEKEQLNVTLRSIGDAVITTDLDGRIVLMNRVAECLTGWSHQEAVGLPLHKIFKIYNEETGRLCDNPVDKVLASRKTVSLANHTIMVDREGTQYVIEDSGAPIFDSENEIIGTVLVFRDATEEKRTREELLKVKKLESVGVLAGGIAHDFNNLLTAILGNIELAEMSVASTEEAFPLLQDAKKASVRARDLTRQLLTFSKGGAPVKHTSSISEIITDSADFVLRGSLVVCNYCIPEDLWRANVDTGQMSQVIQNIIINGCDAMSEGGVIEVICENIVDIRKESVSLPVKEYIKISITDSGCGIPEQNIDKIFDPYFSSKQTGSGLGLAICHSIISKHDGDISVQSHVNEGTTFTIYIPVDLNTAQDTKTPESSPIEAERKATILVMDDEPIVRDVTKKMLERFGYEVLLAENGHEAIAIYNEYFKNNLPIDVVIMDLTIPGNMGGKDAVQEILRIDQKAIVVVASGYSNSLVMAHYQEYGFAASIAKPFQLEELHKVVNAVLG